MTWVRIDDGAPLHPKLLDVGAEAAWLWIAGLAHCNRAVTNGAIRKTHLEALYPTKKWSAKRLAVLAQRLVDAKLWVDDGEKYVVHDYDHYQEEALRGNVESRREAAKHRKREQRKREREQREREKLGRSPPSHIVTPRDSHAGHGCDESRDSHRDLSRDSARDAVGDARLDVSQPPDPSRPVPYERESRDALSAKPSADMVSVLVSGFSLAYEANGKAPPRETRSMTWRGWHDLAAWVEAQAAVEGCEPEAVAQELSARFFRSRKARTGGFPITFLAANPLEFWEAA